MPFVIVGKVLPETTKLNSNNETRWIKGNIRVHPTCQPLLRTLHQSRLPFTLVSGQVLPLSDCILVGEISEYQIPNTNILWKTLAIDRIITRSDTILKTLDISFQDACHNVAQQNEEFLKTLGTLRVIVKKQLTDILGTRNNFADTLLSYFNEDAYDKLIENPWEIIHIIPYYTVAHADKVAEKLGIPLDDKRRFYAIFRQQLDTYFQTSNHTYMSENEFKAFYWMHFADTMSEDEYQNLASTAQAPIIQSEMGYHPTYLYYAERNAFSVLASLLESSISQSDIDDEALLYAIDNSPVDLTREQIHGLKHALSEPFHIITGGPGTGKTTTLHAILQKIRFVTNMDDAFSTSQVLLVSPTGKGAARMQEQSGMDAYTIHSAFGILPDYGCTDVEGCAKRLSHIRYIIIDEASMLDAQTFGDMCRVFKHMTHIPSLLLMGDVDQLPPVGFGQVFKDILTHVEQHCPTHITRLQIVQRQGKDSNIPLLAEYIRKGQFPNATWFNGRSDVLVIPTEYAQFPSLLCNSILQTQYTDINTIQLITPYRNGTQHDTVPAINTLAAPFYNPCKEGEQEVSYGNPPRIFRVGDKVVNRVNKTMSIVNGSIGMVQSIYNSGNDIFAWSMDIVFGDEVLTYLYEDWKALEPAYAITIHASQGSEYDNVVVIMLRNNNNTNFLTRNLLYTAITRARKKVVLIGQPSTFTRIAATPQAPRNTALAYWLSH